MRIRDISLRGFRSYDEAAFAGLGDLVVFVGPNAVGKTNAIEALGMLTALTSFRHAPTSQMVAAGSPAARLQMTATDGNRLLEVAVSLGERRRYELNGKPKRPVDLKGLVPSITFTPDDLALAKGGGSLRRRALDELGSQVNRNYYLIHRDYEKVVRHKNRLLKEEAPDALLDAIDEMAVTCGAQLTCYRAALFERLRGPLQETYVRIAHGEEALEATYAPSWEAAAAEGAFAPARTEGGLDPEVARERLAELIQARRPEERARKRAVAGPQSDAISFAIDGMAAQHYASQGQQRSIVLAHKLAEAAVVEEMLGVKPILLLDDVMSELDGSRREALVGYLASDVQAFITTANLDYFDEGMLAKAQVIELASPKR